MRLWNFLWQFFSKAFRIQPDFGGNPVSVDINPDIWWVQPNQGPFNIWCKLDTSLANNRSQRTNYSSLQKLHIQTTNKNGYIYYNISFYIYMRLSKGGSATKSSNFIFNNDKQVKLSIYTYTIHKIYMYIDRY